MSSCRPASFGIQANALLRKNLTYQKRNKCVNCRLISFPLVLCFLISLMQVIINKAAQNELGKNRKCGSEHSALDAQSNCLIRQPLKWPPVVQIPAPENRAVRTTFLASSDFPDESCRRIGSCPAITLVTGANRSLGEVLTNKMFSTPIIADYTNDSISLADLVLGSATYPQSDNYLEPAFAGDLPVYSVQIECTPKSTFLFHINQSSVSRDIELQCAKGLYLWRNSSFGVNDELYKGYQRGNVENKINEFVGAYDLLNTNENTFNISLWYNSTFKNYSSNAQLGLSRVPRSLNLVSNAFLQYRQSSAIKMLLEFVKEMPKPETMPGKLDISSQIGSLFFTWAVLLLFPVMRLIFICPVLIKTLTSISNEVLSSLVYEKEKRLRVMMKMHGLGDGPYWMISYLYFLVISVLYIAAFVMYGSVIGLGIFKQSDYSLQFFFFLIYINLQVSMAFLMAAMFSNVKTAQVVAYIIVFGSGLLGGSLFEPFIRDPSFPRLWIILMELYPGFSLYRGLYELGQYSSNASYIRSRGMTWDDLHDSANGMREVLIIMSIEWLVVLLVGYCADQVASSSRRTSCLSGLWNFKKKSSVDKLGLQSEDSKVFLQFDKPDVIHEREKVQQLLLEPIASHAIICDDLKKLYAARDGNPIRFAVRGVSLALPPGECFGMLGPNGAGKTSFINMMVGLTKPSSGKAFIQGLDIQTQMTEIYSVMGVCPQHDLLWETLTGREHLLFYGRLKNLKGSDLKQAVEESLKRVNLWHGGVADKQAGKYSGGMKRRLSVAISLIGNPKVVFMDEPSTGLDPASRSSLWNVIKCAKRDCAIILTTHSMEEAEFLCDRLGIFVTGSLRCIGNPKQLKARYGGSYILSITTASHLEGDVERLVRRACRSAKKMYQIAGTQKFEMQKMEVGIADVLEAVERAKRHFLVSAWGISDTTLEDVFIKVAQTALEDDGPKLL